MGKKIQSIGKYKFCYDTLGKGSFARVELVVHEVTKCKVAMKIINTRKITDDYVINNLYREARILSQLNHPNIIKFYESLKADAYYCLVTECAFGGDLSDYMVTFDDHRFPENVARHYMRQLVSALQYMHERRVVHRDLKMENLMLDKSKKHLKIVDFGLSNNLPTKTELLSTHCGSPEYAAPELFITNSTYGPEVDIWSLGIVFYTCVVGQLPFYSPYYDHSRRQRLLNIISKGLNDRHRREMIHLTSDCKYLIKEMLEPLPHLRIPIEDITNHQWITDQDKLPFTPYFSKPKYPEMKCQIIDKLAKLTTLKKIEVERFVHENGTNELSAMFKMLLEEAKNEAGYYEEDHTCRPMTLVSERKKHLAQAKWRKLRYRLKESARVFREMINNKQQMQQDMQTSGNTARPTTSDASKLLDDAAREEAILQRIESRQKKHKIRSRVNPVGIVKTEKKKDLFPQKRSVVQAPKSTLGADNDTQRLSRSRQFINVSPKASLITGSSNIDVRTANSPSNLRHELQRQRHVGKSIPNDVNKSTSSKKPNVKSSSLSPLSPPRKQTSSSTSKLKPAPTIKPTPLSTQPASKVIPPPHKPIKKSRSANLATLHSTKVQPNKLHYSASAKMSTSRSAQKLNTSNSSSTRKRDKSLPMAPLACIDEINLGIFEAAKAMDGYEPRFCLVKVTDDEMSSGVMLSSTISELSDVDIVHRKLSTQSSDAYENTNNAYNATISDLGANQSSQDRLIDSQRICNGGVAVNCPNQLDDSC